MEKQQLPIGDSLEAVIAAYGTMVYRLAVSRMKNRSDADDIFQEVFFRYIRKKPVFASEEHRKAWLIRVTVNCCKNMYASAWFKRTEPLTDRFVCGLPEESVLIDALEKLPGKYRTVLHLFYYEEMSVAEIGQALGKKPSAIKMRLSRARGRLKELLSEEEFDV